MVGRRVSRSSVSSSGTPVSRCKRRLSLSVSALGSSGGPLLHMGTYLQLEAASLSATTRAAVPLLASWDLAHVMQHLLKPKCLKNLTCPHCVDQVASFTLTAPGGCMDRHSHGASGP